VSKYEALPHFLASVDRVAQRMSFAEIEGILGFKLPQSAYEHVAWWSNNATGHSHSRTWLKFGWRTEAVDLAGRKVTFRRASRPPLPAAPLEPHDPWGCMAGTVTILPGTDLTASSNDKWNAQDGRLINE